MGWESDGNGNGIEMGREWKKYLKNKWDETGMGSAIVQLSRKIAIHSLTTSCKASLTVKAISSGNIFSNMN